MNLRAALAVGAMGLGTVGGILVVSAPAWAACSVSAAKPTSGHVSKGTRSGCAGAAVNFEVRFEKDVAFLPDLPVAYTYTTFQNGSLSVTGNCGAGNGEYYTWVLQNGSSAVESPRVTQC
ncbi:hypothetical protein [Actinoplanes palleronii]|uniref:Uncharacterized protein n=1 Tax=Actinoplanes palleronii TaxID=113570 RepID=A0ABQ4BQY6_9ACTN|nr:hypothetical protein [Actinoplanes palleronii]GIE73072.1 hypothetical protein Apa02nite_091800 [Actinoplanes palleronii]